MVRIARVSVVRVGTMRTVGIVDMMRRVRNEILAAIDSHHTGGRYC